MTSKQIVVGNNAVVYVFESPNGCSASGVHTFVMQFGSFYASLQGQNGATYALANFWAQKFHVMEVLRMKCSKTAFTTIEIKNSSSSRTNNYDDDDDDNYDNYVQVLDAGDDDEKY